MFLALRFIPFLSSIIICCSFVLNHFYPFSLKYVTIISIITPAITVYLILSRSYNETIKSNLAKTILQYMIIPIFFNLSTLGFLSFINQPMFFYIVTVLFGLIYFVYLEDLFIYLYFPPRYPLGSLESLTDYISVIIIFLTFVTFFELIIFVSLSVWILTIASALIVILLSYNTIFINKMADKMQWIISSIHGLIIAELFTVVVFFPSSFFVNSMIITLAFYILSGINKSYLLQKLNKKVIIRYSGITLVLMILVLITARWT